RGNKGSIRDHSASLNHVNCLPIIASTKAETLNQQQSLSATLLSTDPRRLAKRRGSAMSAPVRGGGHAFSPGQLLRRQPEGRPQRAASAIGQKKE
ncbi:MAG TPA: hypothetical protein VGO55_18560, partial [Allosphingosinicella sp.]|nr:hypothetical protein [Allosphingosinicella sp.]